MIAPTLIIAALCLGVTSNQPNFILILTDDISQDDIGCYGNPLVKTPNLDRIAAQGMKFDNAYLTCSSCSPSRCSLITGRYPHNTGACELHTELPAGHTLFPLILREAGYYTVLSGKHHMGPQADIAFDTVSPGESPGRQGNWVELLRSRPRDKPFFAWFASGDAHRSWTQSDDAPVYDPATVAVPPFLVDGPKTRQDLAHYYHEVSRTDTFAGRIVAELEAQGIAEETYLIYMSDNGRPFPRCKTRLYDSGIKTPFIVYAPGAIEPSVTDALISVNVDLGPTLLALAGLGIPERMQGVSFVDVLRNPAAVVREYVFAEQNWHVMQAHQRMVRQGDFVYIRNAYPELQAMCVEAAPKFPAGEELWEHEATGNLLAHQRDIFQQPRAREELYNVRTDPNQFVNAIDDSAHTAQLNILRSALDRWVKETCDSVPTDPTRDRQDAHGNRNSDWKHRTQPGVEIGSIQTNAKGPIRAR